MQVLTAVVDSLQEKEKEVLYGETPELAAPALPAGEE
jgi:hypothetical protein